MRKYLNMILGKSKDPVHLKKIPLKVWSLKKEIETTYLHYQKINTDELEKVKKFYELAYEEQESSSSEQTEQAAETQSESEGASASASEDSTPEGTVVDINTGLPLKKMSPEEIKEYRNQINRIIPDKEFVSIAHTFLFDITIDEVLLFSEKSFNIGQTIVIQFDITQGFALMAEVSYVRNIALKSRVISEHRPNFRIVAKLILNKPGDRTLLRSFLSAISPHDRSAASLESEAKKEPEVVIDEGATESLDAENLDS